MPALEISSASAIDSASKSQSTKSNTSTSDGLSFKDTFDQESQRESVNASEKKAALNESSKGAKGSADKHIESSTDSSAESKHDAKYIEELSIFTLENVSIDGKELTEVVPTLESLEEPQTDSLISPFNIQLLAVNKPSTGEALRSGSEFINGLNWQTKSVGGFQGAIASSTLAEASLMEGRKIEGAKIEGTKMTGGTLLLNGVATQAITTDLASVQNALGVSGKTQPFMKSFDGTLSNIAATEMTTTLPELSPSGELTGVGLSSAKIPGLENLEQHSARFSVNVQFGKPEWNAGLASKVAQMAAQNLNFAEIQLDPPELGPLQVRIQMNHDQATVSFTSASPQVREALEQGNNRLREMLEGEGLNLVDVDVKDQGQQNKDSELESDHAEGQLVDTEEHDNNLTPVMQGSAEIKMGVDDFV